MTTETDKKPKRNVTMRIGMLWYEDDEAAREDVLMMIARAAGHYSAKFSQTPNFCHIHPDAFGDQKVMQTGGGMKIVLDKSIQLHHVWLGVVR